MHPRISRERDMRAVRKQEKTDGASGSNAVISARAGLAPEGRPIPVPSPKLPITSLRAGQGKIQYAP